MKAITIKQPWATLIALGEKKFETRSWKTKYRGKIAIHAGKSVDKEACEKNLEIISALRKHGYLTINQLPTGSVVAIANLKDCHQVGWDYGVEEEMAVLENHKVIDGDEYWFGDYETGRYAWELENVEMLPKPISAKGQLSLWEWQEDK